MIVLQNANRLMNRFNAIKKVAAVIFLKYYFAKKIIPLSNNLTLNLMNQKQKNNSLSDYLKSNRKGSREAELMISPGWVAKDRPHKNRKMYYRDREKRNWKDDNSNSVFSLLFFNHDFFI